jgi:hypothetical protein
VTQVTATNSNREYWELLSREMLYSRRERTNANITFHTNDEDKDDDTVVSVSVRRGPTIAAQITDRFQHFNDHSDAGPFDLEIVTPLTRDELKTGGFIVNLEITPIPRTAKK